MTSKPGPSDPSDVVEVIPAEFDAAVSARLDAFFEARREQLALIGVPLGRLLEAARSSVEGGKRLRPAFAYWGWRAAGRSPDKTTPIVTAAAAIELVHASALVHDDVMDDSATRRGKPSAHRAFTDDVAPATRPDVARAFGISAAILLGDLLLSWSDELFAAGELKPKMAARGRLYFDLLRTEVVAGQYLDVLGQATGSSSASDALRVVRYKSAKYTVERPLQLGAALGKADRHLLRALSSYGIPLGEAFQLRDDVLGVFGESGMTGKPSGDDIREGKRTLLMARATSRATSKQQAVLDRNFANPTVSTAGIEATQQVIRDTGALAAVETVIAELTEAALSTLEKTPISDEQARSALRLLADRATNREV